MHSAPAGRSTCGPNPMGHSPWLLRTLPPPPTEKPEVTHATAPRPDRAPRLASPPASLSLWPRASPPSGGSVLVLGVRLLNVVLSWALFSRRRLPPHPQYDLVTASWSAPRRSNREQVEGRDRLPAGAGPGTPRLPPIPLAGGHCPRPSTGLPGHLCSVCPSRELFFKHFGGPLASPAERLAQNAMKYLHCN